MFSLFVYHCLKCLNNEWNYETNIKHGYSLIVYVSGGVILNLGGASFKSRGRIYSTRVAILKSGAQHWGPQGLDFCTMLATGVGPAK